MAGFQKNIYSNNIDPYAYEINVLKDMKLSPQIKMTDLADLPHISKLAIADTFHDLAQPRVGYDQTHFNETVLPRIIEDDIQPETDKKLYYKTALSRLFGGTVGPSQLEPSVNAYIENVFGLQPAYEEITFDDILDHPVKFNDETLKKKIEKSNGSLKITVPQEYTSFTHYLTKFIDDTSYHNAQKGISRFIKNYLFQTDDRDIADIRFLFDAGANQIGKIFRYPNSGGIRYNGMACTADSASSSDESLDPTKPNEYEPDRIVKVTSNFFTSNVYDIHFIVNDHRTFGKDGKTCFSVSITNKDDDPTVFEHSARYFFGPQKNNSAPGDPCGTEGASVSHIGKTMAALKGVESKNDQVAHLNSVKKDKTYNSSCIPLGDSQFLKLFAKKGGKIKNVEEINVLLKLLADCKRTGDYEQSLTLARKIKNDGGNSNNYTFSSVDLLSTLFARMNGIPSVYQVGVNGTITLYRNTLNLGSEADREAAIQTAKENVRNRRLEYLKTTYKRLKHVLTSPGFISILEDFEKTKFPDENTELQKTKIYNVFITPLQIFNKDLIDGYSEDNYDLIDKIHNTIHTHYPSILNESLVIGAIPDINNFTLPFLDFIVREGKSKKSTYLDKLKLEKTTLEKNIAADTGGTSARDVTRQTSRTKKLAETNELIKEVLNSITYTELPFRGGGKTIRELLSAKKTERRKTYKSKTTNKKKTIKKNFTAKKKIQKLFYRYEKPLYSHLNTGACAIELKGVIDKVLDSSNEYLKDIYGSRKPLLTREMKKNQRKTLREKYRQDSLATKRDMRIEENMKEVGYKTRKKMNTIRKLNSIIIPDIIPDEHIYTLNKDFIKDLGSYSASNLLFLNKIRYEFIDALELIVLNYNYNSISYEKLTIDILFGKYKILSFLLILLTPIVYTEDTKINEKINENVRLYVENVMEGVAADSKSGTAISLFALVGYYMNNFHVDDYFFNVPKTKEKEKYNLDDHLKSPTKNLIEWKYQDKMVLAFDTLAFFKKSPLKV
jgi:hypothetical protein